MLEASETIWDATKNLACPSCSTVSPLGKMVIALCPMADPAVAAGPVVSALAEEEDSTSQFGTEASSASRFLLFMVNEAAGGIRSCSFV